MFLLTLLPCQKGEVDTRTVSGTVFCQEDNAGPIPLGGASISLVAGKDTLNTISDNLGRYSFSIDDIFQVTILARYQGFDDFRETYNLFEDHTAIAIRMNRSAQQLEAATIKSEVPFVRIDADTTIFNMAALEKMEGDRALSLLQQIPGFAIVNGKLMIWGEFIDKTYVNGLLVYGDDPMSALALLKADEVKDVHVYDTQYMEDKVRGLKHSKKRRVIDLHTFKQFFSSVDIQAQSRIGEIYEEQEMYNPLRYSAGVDYDSNKEMEQIGLHLNGNNINNGQNGIEVTRSEMPVLFSDNSQFATKAEYVKKWKDAEWGNMVTIGYDYNYHRDLNQNATLIDRIASEGNIEPLHYESFNSTKGRTRYHKALVGAEFHRTPLSDLEFYLGVICDDTDYEQLLNLVNDTGLAGVQSQNQVSKTITRALSISPQIKWSNPYAKSGWVPNAFISYNFSRSPQYSFTKDTLNSSTTRRDLEGDGDDVGNAALMSFWLKKALIDSDIITSELELRYQAEYGDEHKKMFTVDRLLEEGGQTDLINSYDYSWNTFSNLISVGYSLTSASVQLIAVNVGLKSERLLDTERFPQDIHKEYNFMTPCVSLSIAPPLRKDKLYISYFLQGETPAIEQMRKRVDNRNPLRIRMGNPDLKASRRHTIGINYFPHISEDGSSFAIRGLFTIRQNPIVNKIEYYSAPGTLNAWGVDYDIQAGTTLTEYENAGLSTDMFCGMTYDCRIKPLKGIIRSEISSSLRRSPEYMGDNLNCLTTINPALKVSLSVTPAKFLRLTLASETSYIKQMNDCQTILSEAVVENSAASAEIRFLKHFFGDIRYSGLFYRYKCGMGVDNDIHDLTAAVGAFLFNGKLACSISGSDMLGRALNYSTNSTSSEFTSNTESSLGRYFLINFAYRFSNRK